MSRTARRVAVIFLILTLSFVVYQIKATSPISNVKRIIKLPFDSIQGFWQSSVRYFEDIWNVYKENKQLKAQLTEALLQRQRYAEIIAENKRLKDLLALKNNEPNFITAARVVSLGGERFIHVVTLDKGSKDGVKKDMAIVTPSGLAGKIYSTTEDFSKALLLRDYNFSVSARLQEVRHEGIISGTGRTFCVFKYIPPDVKVEKGDVIVTSGRDGIFPSGIPIGVVESVKKEGVEFFQEIQVRPFQSEARLEEVAVIRSAQ